MKRIILIFITLFITFLSVSSQNVVNTSLDGHPRLFLNGEDFTTVVKNVKANQMLSTIENYIMQFADETIEKPFNERVLKGRRLLETSADCFTRIFYFSYAYRATGEQKYLDYAIGEMLAVSSFIDWHPEHFLDTAELMCGMAIGYDWCYVGMTPEQRELIRTALIEKGLKPSLDLSLSGHWLKSTSNWNQVCNAASTLAALAVIDTNPEYAQAIIPRAVKAIELPMNEYNPDGAYREGPGYWCYGTGYNVLFLAALEKYYGNDFGLTEKFPAFLKTVDYHIAMMTPSYQVFCYADQAFPAQVSVAPFYLYNKTGNRSYLYMVDRLLKDVPLDLAHCRHRRILPAALIFGGLGANDLSEITIPEKLYYVAGGRTPVAAFRSDWSSKEALYLGFKLGSPSEGHNHMDEGSFFFEAQGVRWALDLGGENYTKIEKAKVDLWSYGPDAGRWRLLRTGLFGHNCLIIDDCDQNVKGRAKIDDYSTEENNMFAESDLSTLYSGQVESVVRRVSMVDKKYIVIEDRIKTGSEPVNLRWNMATEAVSLDGKGSKAKLTSVDGKELSMRIEGNAKVSIKEWSAQPNTSYEAKNEGKMFVGYTSFLHPNKEYIIKVTLTPIN